MRKVVSNSSTLIHLGKIGLLDLLSDQFGEILIPKAVWQEVVEEGREELDVKSIVDAKWIKVQEVKRSPILTTFLTLLDRGEAEAIALAIEVGADLVLLDESEARKMADLYNLRKTGLLGVLMKAKQQRKIKSLEYYLNELSKTGFYVSRQLYDEVLEFATGGNR